MRLKLLILLLLVVGILTAEDYLDINFFIEPHFKFENKDMLNFRIKNIRNDSIPQITALAGKLLQDEPSDSLRAEFLNLLQPAIAAPTDFLFADRALTTKLLISNIESDSIPIIKHKIIKADSFKVGIFAIYTPDFPVKNKIAAEFDFKVFQIAREQANHLKKKTDYVIMLSNISKYIDQDIVRNIPVDAVISFDYQKKRNEKLNKTTSFYSILTHDGNYGKLRLIYQSGKISHIWNEKSWEY